jgi:phage tail sheath protein FI
MAEYLTPGVYFEWQDAAPPVIRKLRMDIAGFVGLAERGPLNQPVLVASWTQFQSVFGAFVPYSFLAYAVKGFFENGGRNCFVVRITGPTATRADFQLKTPGVEGALTINAINEGTWGNRITFRATQMRPQELELSLVVTYNHTLQERFSRISLNPEHSRYLTRLINQGSERQAPSQWIRVKDNLSSDLQERIDWLRSVASADQNYSDQELTGGQDGLATLTKEDFLGTTDLLIRPRKGLSALDEIDSVGILCMPDLHIQPTAPIVSAPPPKQPLQDPCRTGQVTVQQTSSMGQSDPLEQPFQLSLEDIFDIQRAMVEHCERHQDRTAILDVPWSISQGNPGALNRLQAWRSRFDSDHGFGALYHPWITVIDPLHLEGKFVRAIPPCGHIAGLYAHTDHTVGVHKAPANEALNWAEGTTCEINDAMQDGLNPEGINCLRSFPGRGIRVYGARTISSDPDWRYINVRRLLSTIEEGVDESTQWSVFEPNDAKLRQLLKVGVSSFLEALWRQGALVGKTAAEAFYVKCDESNNPASVIDAGQLIVEVGVKPAQPTEFIVFRVGRTAGELEVIER